MEDRGVEDTSPRMIPLDRESILGHRPDSDGSAKDSIEGGRQALRLELNLQPHRAPPAPDPSLPNLPAPGLPGKVAVSSGEEFPSPPTSEVTPDSAFVARKPRRFEGLGQQREAAPVASAAGELSLRVAWPVARAEDDSETGWPPGAPAGLERPLQSTDAEPSTSASSEERTLSHAPHPEFRAVPSSYADSLRPAESPLPHPLPPIRSSVPTGVLAVLVVLLLMVSGGAVYLASHRHPPPLTAGESVGQAEGSLSIVTRPAGAHVKLGGRNKGVTPLTIKGLSANVYDIEVTKAGYLPVHKSVGLDLGQKRTESFKLEKPASLIVADVPGGSEVLVDGAPIKTRTLQVAAGAHLVVVRAPGYTESRDHILVEAGQVRTFSPRLVHVGQARASGEPPPSVVVMPAAAARSGGTGPAYAPPPPPRSAPDGGAPPPATAPPPPRPASGVVVGERPDMKPAPTPVGIPGLNL